MAHRICIRQWGTPYYFESGDFCKFKVVSHGYVTGCQSSPSCVIARAWNSKMLPNSYLILMRVLWVVIKSSLATCSVNSAFSSEQSLGLCADPSKLTRRFIQLFSKGPHSWAYSQEGELVFQWISLSIWMASGWNTAPAEGRPWVMNSFVFCHLQDQMLEAVKTLSTAREMISLQQP